MSARTDTQLIPITSGRPLPDRLSPRQSPLAQRIIVTFLLCVGTFVGATLSLPLIAVFAYLVPQSVIVAMVVLLVAYVIVRKAMQATAAQR